MAGFRESKPADGVEPEHAEEPEDELKGIGDIADLLREVGRERRRFGEDLMRLFEVRWQKEG